MNTERRWIACASAGFLLVLAAAPACKKETPEEVRAKELCGKLVAAGVAKNCKLNRAATDTENGFASASFEVVDGFPGTPGRVSATAASGSTRLLAAGAAAELPCVPNEGSGKSDEPWCPPADDYFNHSARSSSAELDVVWNGGAGIDDSPWNRCRGIHNPVALKAPSLVRVGGAPMADKSVAECAKLYPKEYAAYHALFDAATAAVMK